MNAIEFDTLDVKKVSESQKCAQSVLSSNERHTRDWLLANPMLAFIWT